MPPIKNMKNKSQPKNFKKSLFKMIGLLKPYKLVVIFALILGIIGTTVLVLGPYVLEKLLKIIMLGISSSDSIYKANINFKMVITISIILLLMYAFYFIFIVTRNIILSKVSANINKNLRNEMNEKINKLPLKYFDKFRTGDIMSRMTNDIDTIGINLNDVVSNLISIVITIVGVAIMMFVMSWQLALIVIITVPISFIVVAKIIKISQKYFLKQQEVLGQLNSIVEENYTGHNVLKVFNGEQKANLVFEDTSENMRKISMKANFISGLMMPITNFISNVGYVVVCIVGVLMAIKNPIFLATIIPFMTYVKQFNQPIGQISNISATLQSMTACSERVFEFIDEENETIEDKTENLKNVLGNIEFKNVNFGYTEDKQIIFNFNCNIKSGQKVAIVGPTGAGKTTIVNLLMRFYDTTSGDILIDGKSIYKMSRKNVRKLFGMVLQDTWLFDGTINENLKFGNSKATDSEVINACQLCSIDHVIKTMKNGYNMVLDEKSNLSQGEKQLLTIARVMVKNAPMLILDEATSNVDTRTEVSIQKAMDELMKNRTSFIIAHRLSTIKNADLILVLKDGNIVEIGKHNELLIKKGYYADLYNSQFTISKQTGEDL